MKFKKQNVFYPKITIHKSKLVDKEGFNYNRSYTWDRNVCPG